MAAPYSPTTPTPAWPSPSTVNQHRSHLTNKRKADAILDSNDIDSTANSSISSQFKKLRLNQQRNGITNANTGSSSVNSVNFNTFHHNQQQPQPQQQQQQQYYQHHPNILTPTSPTSRYRPHIANTDVRPALPLPPLPPTPTLPRHSSSALSPSPRTPTPTARTTGPTALATSYRRIHDPPAARPLPASSSPSHPSPAQQQHTRNSSAASSIMAIDETPNRIIINDLEAEIAIIEADEAARRTTVFIPDIDKKVSAIPQRLLQNSSNVPISSSPSAGPGSGSGSGYNFNLGASHAAVGGAGVGVGVGGMGDPTTPVATALVLYKEPTSISVPESEDVVRKTIIAARQRAREKAAEDQRDRDRERQRFLSEYRSGRAHGGPMDNGGDPDFFDDAMTDHSSQGGDFDLDVDDMDPDAMDIE